MKHVYLRFINAALPLLLILIFHQASYTQTCPDGSPQGGTAFDTTIATPPGITTRQIKFPKFNPMSGMVTCVRLCVTITGIVDTMSIENGSASPQTADVDYIRTDDISGPGLVSHLTNSLNQHYGQYNLGASDGSPGSGLDFVSISKDTVLNAVTMCRTISDSTTIAQFYGLDSVSYTYNITALVSPTSSGSYSFSVGTSAFANFHFEYCTCPATVLPLNVREFNVTKLAETKAELKWTGFDDPYANYHYEVELSRNGHTFSSIGSFEKNTTTNEAYKMLYTAPNGESGIYYFRIKQVYSNGYVRFSNIREAALGSSVFAKFSVYPNPSTGIVGIKFDNSSAGRFDIQIYNAQGQVIVNKEIAVNGSSFVQVATLNSGNYWLRLTDKKSQESCVNQLLIK